MIQKWLKTCASNHRQCKVKAPGLEELLSGEMVTLPTRVVNVGATDSTEPFLFETKGIKGLYLALSHCWGTARVTTTTISTLDPHRTRLPLELLPQNFRDAILVTQKLGFQYLWI